MRNLLAFVACLLLAGFLTGYTGTLRKNDGTPFSGVVVTVEDARLGTVISRDTTDAQGGYTVGITDTTNLRITFKSTHGSRVAPDVLVPAQALSGRLYRSTIGDSLVINAHAGFDSVARQSQTVGAQAVFGNTIKTQDQMRPIYAVRFDDFRPEVGRDSYPFLILRVPISLAINKSTLDATDSTMLANILARADSCGTRVEILTHTATSMSVTGRGYSETYGDWRDYWQFTAEDWRDELDTSALESLTGQDVIGGIWPGDGGGRADRKSVV